MKIEEFNKRREATLRELEKKFIEVLGTQEVELPVKYFLFGEDKDSGTYMTGIRYNSINNKMEYLIQNPQGESWKDESSCNDEERKGILWEKRTALVVSLKCDHVKIISLDGEELDREEHRIRERSYSRKIFGYPVLRKDMAASTSSEEREEQENCLFQELKKRFLNKFETQEVEFQCSWLYIWENYRIKAHIVGIKYDSSSDRFLYKFKYLDSEQEVWKELEGEDTSINPTIMMSNYVLMVALNVKETYILLFKEEELERDERFMRDPLVQ